MLSVYQDALHAEIGKKEIDIIYKELSWHLSSHNMIICQSALFGGFGVNQLFSLASSDISFFSFMSCLFVAIYTLLSLSQISISFIYLTNLPGRIVEKIVSMLRSKLSLSDVKETQIRLNQDLNKYLLKNVAMILTFSVALCFCLDTQGWNKKAIPRAELIIIITDILFLVLYVRLYLKYKSG